MILSRAIASSNCMQNAVAKRLFSISFKSRKERRSSSRESELDQFSTFLENDLKQEKVQNRRNDFKFKNVDNSSRKLEYEGGAKRNSFKLRDIDGRKVSPEADDRGEKILEKEGYKNGYNNSRNRNSGDSYNQKFGEKGPVNKYKRDSVLEGNFQRDRRENYKGQESYRERDHSYKGREGNSTENGHQRSFQRQGENFYQRNIDHSNHVKQRQKENYARQNDNYLQNESSYQRNEAQRTPSQNYYARNGNYGRPRNFDPNEQRKARRDEEEEEAEDEIKVDNFKSHVPREAMPDPSRSISLVKNSPSPRSKVYPATLESSEMRESDRKIEMISKPDDEGEEYLVHLNFVDFGVPQSLIPYLAAMKIKTPTRIQAETISFIMEGRDVLIRSATASGKTMGLLIAMLSMRTFHADKIPFVRRLWIVPTPQLALQIHQWIKMIFRIDEGPQLSSIVGLALPPEPLDYLDLVGGSAPHEGGEEIVPDLLIGTIGGVKRVMKENKFDLTHVKSIVIDEVDSVIKPLSRYATYAERKARIKHPNEGLVLLRDLRKGSKVKNIQLIAASATINTCTRRDLLMHGFIKRPVFVNVGVPFTIPTIIKHNYFLLFSDATQVNPVLRERIKKYATSDAHSIDLTPLVRTEEVVIEAIALLYELESVEKKRNGILFIESCASKKKMQEMLARKGISVDLIGKDLCENVKKSMSVQVIEPQEEEDQLDQVGKEDVEMKIINSFAENRTPSLLLASDTDARGLDLRHLDYVIIVSSPRSFNEYLHMAGRVGRRGAVSKVITILRDDKERRRVDLDLKNSLKVAFKPYKMKQ